MELNVSMRDGTLVIKIENDTLDATSAGQFKQQVMQALEKHETYQLILNLENLKFIDSSGLGAFLSLLRHVTSHDGDLKLSAMRDSVRTMFQIVRMHKLFEIHDTVDECRHSFAHRG